MTETFVLITPAHCFSHKDYLAARYEELGVKNARNLVGRIGNLWFRSNRIERSLNDWEKNRRAACQNLADSGIEGRQYKADDRPELLYDKKRAKEQRDNWHFKVNLFRDLEKLMSQLPQLYVTQEELWEARKKQVEQLMLTYGRRRRLKRLNRKHQARPRNKPLA